MASVLSSELGNRVALLINADADEGEDHVAWSDDATIVLGLTRIGRATVEPLQLNREALVKLRHVLVEAGEHPP